MIKRQTLPRMRSLHLISTALLGGLFASACSDHEPTVPRSALATAGPSATRTPVNYKFTAIDTILIPGARLISAQGINADGDIAGSYVDANLRQHGFVLHGGVVTTIDYRAPDGTFADGTNVEGIGPDGEVVGTHWMNTEEPAAFHGFRRTATGDFQTVHYPGHLYEIPQRILPDGTILGCRHDADFSTTGLSMHGIVIGRKVTSELDIPVSMTNGATPDRHRLVAQAMNMSTGFNQAFTIDDGVINPIHIAGAIVSTAWDVDPRGDVVGFYRDANGFHGYVLSADGLTTTTLNAPGATATRAFGINARGDVVGTTVSGGKTFAFVATPEP